MLDAEDGCSLGLFQCMESETEVWHRQDRSVVTTQLLFGEAFEVFDHPENNPAWLFGRCRHDGYIGWVSSGALCTLGSECNHRVITRETLVMAHPDIRSDVWLHLPMGARLHVLAKESDSKWCAVELGSESVGFVPSQHLSEAAYLSHNSAVLAMRYHASPYRWGGRSTHGIDCSGLVQMALSLSGLSCPRDSDQQFDAFYDPNICRDDLRSGDLVFWRGHVGIMRDNTHLIHANAFHMQTVCEPLDSAARRIAASYGEITGFGRCRAPKSAASPAPLESAVGS